MMPRPPRSYVIERAGGSGTPVIHTLPRTEGSIRALIDECLGHGAVIYLWIPPRSPNLRWGPARVIAWRNPSQRDALAIRFGGTELPTESLDLETLASWAGEGAAKRAA